MNSVRVKVHIPKPCSENWEDMLPAEQGRYCLSCQKTVVDFTQKTDAEILDYISRNYNSCGRFYREQILQPHELPRTFFQKWKDYVAAASLVIGTKMAVITPAIAQTTAVLPKVQIAEKAAQQPELNMASDGNIYFKGTLLATEDETPLTGAKVTVQVVNQLDRDTRFFYGQTANSRFASTPYQTITDSSGKFELVVPVVELGKNDYVLNFNFAGNNSYLSLDAFQPGFAVVQYLPKTEFKSEPVSSRREITMGAYPGGVRELVVPNLPGKRKYYRTRAGFVFAKATHPFRWLGYPLRWITYPYRWVKYKIEERSYYG